MRVTNARILIATAGTLGDLLPFIALARKLTERGHEVTIACASGLQSWVRRSGIKTALFDGDFGEKQALEKAIHWDHWKGTRRFQYQKFIAKITMNTETLAELASRADLLLTPTNCPEGRLTRDLTGIPWLSVILMPEEAIRPGKIEDPLLTEAMLQIIKNLKITTPYSGYENYKRSSPSLFACSRALAVSENPQILQTGFWFYEDPAWAKWEPEPALLRFMERPRPPLILTFSSLPLVEPERVLQTHVRAARLLGIPLVVQQGWSGFTPEMIEETDREWVTMADFLPQDWFFARSSGVITHGGIGTLARALRNACPCVIEPYGNDQFYNALLMKRNAFGMALHPHRLTPENLAEAIDHFLFGPEREETRKNAIHASKIISRESGGPGESGTARACQIIEDPIVRAKLRGPK